MSFLKQLYVVVSLYICASVVFESQFDNYGILKPLQLYSLVKDRISSSLSDIPYQKSPGTHNSPGSQPWINTPLRDHLYERNPRFVDYIKPSVSPDGSPWPQRASYLPGFRQSHDSGYSTIRVDNSKGTSDVMAKLVFRAGNLNYPVRTFFVPQGEQFDLLRLSRGSYDVRYKLLTTGEIYKSPPIFLKETQKNQRTEFTSFSLTLYGVINGNSHRTLITADEF